MCFHMFFVTQNLKPCGIVTNVKFAAVLQPPSSKNNIILYIIYDRSLHLLYSLFRFATRTPYLQDNWFDGARDADRKSATEGGSRPLGWWWRFIGGLKRNLEKKAPPTTTAVRSDASQLPETIVTYSIKGCSPTVVPFDLSPCSDLSPEVPQPVSTTRVIYYVPPTSWIDRYNPSDFDQ